LRLEREPGRQRKNILGEKNYMACKATIPLAMPEKEPAVKITWFFAGKVWHTACFILSFYLKKESSVNMLRNQRLE